MDDQVNDMNSSKFIALCGAILAIITVSINSFLPAAALTVSLVTTYTKMSNVKYSLSSAFLIAIALRATFLMQ